MSVLKVKYVKKITSFIQKKKKHLMNISGVLDLAFLPKEMNVIYVIRLLFTTLLRKCFKDLSPKLLLEVKTLVGLCSQHNNNILYKIL